MTENPIIPHRRKPQVYQASITPNQKHLYVHERVKRENVFHKRDHAALQFTAKTLRTSSCDMMDKRIFYDKNSPKASTMHSSDLDQLRKIFHKDFRNTRFSNGEHIPQFNNTQYYDLFAKPAALKPNLRPEDYESMQSEIELIRADGRLSYYRKKYLIELVKRRHELNSSVYL